MSNESGEPREARNISAGEAILANPPHHIYAYILSRTLKNKMQLGIAMDTRTGKMLESVVLPTRQRIMLALGIGNEEAQAHATYRRATRNNYVLHWTDKPEEEQALIEMSERIKRVSAGVQRAIRQPEELTASMRRQIASEAQAKADILPQEEVSPAINPPSPELIAKAREAERRDAEEFQRKFVEESAKPAKETVDWGW